MQKHVFVLTLFLLFASNNQAFGEDETSVKSHGSTHSSSHANNGNENSSKLSIEELNKFLAMDFNEFDQSGKGWRSLKRKFGGKEDYLRTASLLDAYYKKRTDIKRTQRSIVSFHAGQNYGFANATNEAIDRFKNSFQQNQDDWNAYVRASIAFLKKDKKTLKKERNKLAQIQGQMNLSVVDRLIDNFDSTYFDAYSGIKSTP